MNGSGWPISKKLGGTFYQYRRSEGPERLTLLDPRVELVLHRDIARIRQDRSVAERAGANLEAALKPACWQSS